MQEKEQQQISRRRFLKLIGEGIATSAVFAACGEAPTPEPTLKPTEQPSTPQPKTLSPQPSPTPTKAAESTPKPSPTEVPVETIGFGGMDELTEAERETALALKQAYEETVREQELKGRVVLTRGDKEGEIGAFFTDAQNNPWSLVTREEAQVLEQVPFYNGVVAEWKPNEMRFEYLVGEETFVYVPHNRLLLDREGTVVAEWNTESSSWEEVILEPTPEATPTAEPAEECVVESCEPYQELALYHDFSDEQSFSRLVPGTNKTFIVKERRDGRMLIEVTEPSGAKWEAWAGDNPGAYGPVGERLTPAVCEVPHWPDRTPDRKTGIVIKFGNPRQEIEPDRPYIMKYDRVDIGYPYYTRRDARIVAIDRQNQIITFRLSDGSTRQRRFTQNTQVIMMAHEIRAGVPLYRLTGGNSCDLKVGDVASILHPAEPESANPNPNLTDLWGVYIVQ